MIKLLFFLLLAGQATQPATQPATLKLRDGAPPALKAWVLKAQAQKEQMLPPMQAEVSELDQKIQRARNSDINSQKGTAAGFVGEGKRWVFDTAAHKKQAIDQLDRERRELANRVRNLKSPTYLPPPEMPRFNDVQPGTLFPPCRWEIWSVQSPDSAILAVDLVKSAIHRVDATGRPQVESIRTELLGIRVRKINTQGFANGQKFEITDPVLVTEVDAGVFVAEPCVLADWIEVDRTPEQK